MCSEFSFGSVSVLLLPQPRGIWVFVWSDVCTKKSLYILHDTKSTHSSGHQEPLLPLQVFLFYNLFIFFHLCYMKTDLLKKKKKKGAEVSAGERHRQGRGGEAPCLSLCKTFLHR